MFSSLVDEFYSIFIIIFFWYRIINKNVFYLRKFWKYDLKNPETVEAFLSQPIYFISLMKLFIG